MKILSGFIAFMYTVVFLAIGISLVSISLGIMTIDQMRLFLNTIYDTSLNLLYTGFIGVFIIILVLVYVYSATKRKKGEKNISFRNPDGEVSISLTAIEEFIKRISKGVTEIKQLDCKVIIAKKRLKVLNNVIVWSGINIPDISAKFQNMIKLKLQEMLGIEDTIEIEVHVKEVEESKKGEYKSSYEGEIDYSK